MHSGNACDEEVSGIDITGQIDYSAISGADPLGLRCISADVRNLWGSTERELSYR